MPNISVEKFLECVEKSELVEKNQLTQVLAALKEADPSALADAERLATKLIDAKLLTRWQCDSLLQARTTNFVLGQYKLLGMLGKGGMSSVYLGEHLRMKILRAIKVLPVSRVNDSSYLERFDQEATAAARLNHPNIVQAYDIGQHKRYHFIVMEYVEGRDLQDVVKDDGPLEYELAANYIRQAAEGLAYAHHSGLIHRDIKPANLLVDGRGIVKLLDLGLARYVDDKAPSLTIAHDENVLGTADYLAPEQAVDSHGVDSRADIYSLGCTLYYLLTGHPPFPTGTLPQRIHAHQTRAPASIYIDRRDAPQALVDVCNRMMAKSPEARFQTAKEVADALAAWLANRSKGSAGSIGGGGRAEPGARPSAPPRRTGTAVAPPPRRDKPGKSNDTISDKESETFKGPPTGRPQPATTAQARSAGPGGSSKLGKSGPLKPGDSGRAAGRSGKLPTARVLEPPEDPDDLTSVLFGTSAIGSNKSLPRKLTEARRPTKSSSLQLPGWFWYAVAGGLLVSTVVIAILLMVNHKL